MDATNTAATESITVAGATDVGTVVKSTWTITPTETSVVEGGSVSFTISRSNFDNEETVYLSTTIDRGSLNDGDYDYWLNREITFAAGDPNPYVATVVTLPDDEAESAEIHGFIVQTDPSSQPRYRRRTRRSRSLNDGDVYVDPGPGESWTGSSISETR